MKGRTYKMMIPQHVYEIARKIQDELEAQKQEEPGDYETRDSLRKLKRLRKKLNDPSLKDAKYVEVLGLFQQIIETSYCLSASALERIFTIVEIDPELVFEISDAYEFEASEVVKELNRLQDFLQKVPNRTWGTTDSFSKYKYFKLVRTKEEWEKIIKHNGYDLGGDFQYLKIGYVTSRHCFDHFSNFYQNHLIMLGEYDKVEEAFKEWFLIGTIGTFYIYIPE